jgi:hypothetical protein
VWSLRYRQITSQPWSERQPRWRVFESTLLVASVSGYIDIVRLLLDRGANVKQGGGRYSNPLWATQDRGDDEIATLLTSHGPQR